MSVTESKFCSSCGQSIHTDAEICIKCGVRQPALTKRYNKKPRRIPYALLSIFLNQFGAHNFYTNRVKMGVLRILLFIIYRMIPDSVSEDYAKQFIKAFANYNYNYLGDPSLITADLILFYVFNIIIFAFSVQAFISGIIWLFSTDEKFDAYCNKQ
jgi:TM2 domain-containing membrane protein YozV